MPVDPPVEIAVISALTAVITGILTFVQTAYLRRGQDRTHGENAETHQKLEKLDQIEESVNGKMEQLLQMTERRGLARGVAMRTQSVLDGLPFAVIEVGALNGIIMRVNEKACLLFGYSPMELIGSEVEMLVPTEFLDKHRQDRQNYAADPETARPMGVSRAVMGRRKGGSLIPVDVWLSPIRGLDSATSVLATIRRQTEPIQIVRSQLDGP